MYVNINKMPLGVLENLKNEVECAILRAEVNMDIRKFCKFRDDLEAIEKRIAELKAGKEN